MSNTNEQVKEEKKSRSKKPLVALVLAALLGLGAYGGAKYYNNEGEPAKEKVTIRVSAETVTVNDQEQKLAENQNWKQWLESYFAKKDLAKTEVIVDYSFGDYDLVKEIKDALTDLKITSTETKGGGN